VDLKDIKAIIDLMKKNSVSEFELERQDFKIRLKRGVGGGNGGGNIQYEELPPSNYPAPIQQMAGSGQGHPTPIHTQTASNELDVKSPMIGTFYRSPSPEAGPYIDIGSEVNPDTVVCIIEAMKVMNEIKAEVKGIVTQCLMENGKPVEFGQPLFKVRPT
jgi:acetyl-CoA carboxylase biotin carboxyl carrier protein